MLELVQLLSAGFCLHPEIMTYRTGSIKPCEFPSGFALIIHKYHGAILFDTGYSDHFRQETKSFSGALYGAMTPIHLNGGEEAKTQIKKFGITASDVRYVFVSHFHADHFSALKDFPKAKIVCSRAAWNGVSSLTGVPALLKGFLPGLLPDDIIQRLLFVEDLSLTDATQWSPIFGQTWDLFGDQCIQIIKLPGHSIGQIGAVLSYNDSLIMLVADAAWSTKAIENCVPPPAITTSFLGNTKKYRETLTKLNDVWQKELALIVPSHGSVILNQKGVQV